MRRLTLGFLFIIIMSTFTYADTWATAISKHETDGTAIIYRYAQKLSKNFKKEDYQTRVIITWHYTGPNGMPDASENQRMNELEDVLEHGLCCYVPKSGLQYDLNEGVIGVEIDDL